MVWPHEGSTFKKKSDSKRPFFPPCKNWPICAHCCYLMGSHRQGVLSVFMFSAQVSGNKSYWWKHVKTPHVFSVFLCFYFTFKFSQNSNGGKNPNVFYMFLCFGVQVSGHTTNVFCVFLCFFLPTFSLILVQTGTPTQCVWCVFVFFSSQVSGHTTHVFCVFLCFFFTNI